MYTYIYIYMYIYDNIHLSLSLYIYIYIYIYIIRDSTQGSSGPPGPSSGMLDASCLCELPRFQTTVYVYI